MKKNIIDPYATIIIAVVLAILLPLSSCDDLIDDKDANGLALISVDTIKSMSISTLQEIRKLLKTKPNLRLPLTKCSKNYEFILQQDITIANEALLKGNPKFAEHSLKNAAHLVQICEKGFKSSSSPLSAKNNEVRDILEISLSVIKQLL